MRKNEIKNKVRQQDAQVLAQGYSPAIRAMEISAIVAFISLELALVYRLWGSAHTGTWLLLSAVLFVSAGRVRIDPSGPILTLPTFTPASRTALMARLIATALG